MVRVSRAWVRDFGGNPQIYNLLPSHFSRNRRRFECGHTGLEGLTVPSVVSVGGCVHAEPPAMGACADGCRLGFVDDSPLEEAGFEPSVPRAAGAIETRALRRMLSDSEVDSKVKGRTI